MEVISRKQAKADGLKYYFTGISCKRGHIVTRFVSCNSCTECRRLQSKEWYGDKERSAAKRRTWRANNKEKDSKNAADWRKRNPDKVKAAEQRYIAKNPNAKKEACKRWYDRNIEKQRSRAIVYRNQNIETARAKASAWHKSNRAQSSAIARNRRARLTANGGTHTGKDILDIFQMQRGKCACCRILLKNDYHVDHIMPLAMGGGNSRANLQILCRSCNKSKSAKDPIRFMQERGMLL